MAGAAIIVAATLLLMRRIDAAFVAAALGMVAWFLNYRGQMKRVTAAADLSEANEGETENELENE